jgi:hypothetical protein
MPSTGPANVHGLGTNPGPAGSRGSTKDVVLRGVLDQVITLTQGFIKMTAGGVSALGGGYCAACTAREHVIVTAYRGPATSTGPEREGPDPDTGTGASIGSPMGGSWMGKVKVT